ncbi:MAG: T9SS type A sorting domain-containing protein [Bacteroidota bacterium]
MRFATLLLALLAAPAFAQNVWNEGTDAGSLPATAQLLDDSATPYTAITGTIDKPDDVDMYRVFITDPAGFSVTTEPATIGTLADTRLFLFDETGRGIAFNDDTPGGTGSLRSTLPAGHPFMPTQPGTYYVAVSGFETVPLVATSEAIFQDPRAYTFSFNDVFTSNVPDPVVGWLHRGGTATGTYQIELTGAVVPVELTAFDATLDGVAALLRWTTASETNNAGFAVEHRTPDVADFAETAFVAGQGTTTEAQAYAFRFDALTPGTHAFRLRQTDFDGTIAYSPQVEVTVTLAETFQIDAAYPNPFNAETTVRFTVREAAPVQANLFDVTGRQIRTLYAGTPAAGSSQTLRIDGSDLPTGLYIVRVTGRDFTHTQKVTLLK